MDKKLAGLIGAASAMAALSGAQAATPATQPDVETAMKAESFADLLTPIPNAVSVLHAMDASAAKMPAAAKSETFDTKVAQFYYREHHHHHHGYWRPRFHHHHHHGYWRPRYHHHHHHHSYYRY
jgi:hypothetical protein